MTAPTEDEPGRSGLGQHVQKTVVLRPAVIEQAHERVEQALARRPLDTLRVWADRWVLRTLQDGAFAAADRDRLEAGTERLEALIQKAMRADLMCSYLTSAMAVTWARSSHGLPSPYRLDVLRLARSVVSSAIVWREPFRSVFFRWASRLQVTQGPPLPPRAVRGDADALACQLMARTDGGQRPLASVDADWYSQLRLGPPQARAARLCLLPPADPRTKGALADLLDDLDATDMSADHVDLDRFLCRASLGLSRLDEAVRTR